MEVARDVAAEAIWRGADQKLSEFAPLLELVQDEQPRVVVEIGSGGGQAFAAYSKVAATGALLVSVDLPGGDYSCGSLDERRVRAWASKNARLEFIRGDSHEPAVRAALSRTLAGAPVDFLMIDGDHSLGGVQQDYDQYAPLVRPGGMVAFHDILPHDPRANCHVDKLWQRLKRRHESWEFTAAEQTAPIGVWGGIGVIRWQKPPNQKRRPSPMSSCSRRSAGAPSRNSTGVSAATSPATFPAPA